MDRRSQARAVRTILLALFVVSISFVGGMVTAFAADLRAGSGFLNRSDRWSFCLTAARMAAEQERR
jgi:hypothetical protein